MLLCPSGTYHLRERMVKSKDESRSASTGAREDVIHNIMGPLQTYFEDAMRGVQLEQREQARQAVYPSQKVQRARKQETHVPCPGCRDGIGRIAPRSDIHYLE